MRKLDKLVITYFSGPFVVTFFLCLFILLMQFLYKYVDDLVGKGLEWYIIIQLCFYASANLIPMALPLGVLLSSLMTMGNIAENQELMAFKSSGISLLQVMKPLFVTLIIVSIAAFLFSNYILPKANLQFGALMWDIKTKKPTLDIKPGIFYNGIDNYSIRVGQKSKNSEVKDLIIYDNTKSNENTTVIKADHGEMLLSDNEKWLIMKLYNGERYEEVRDNPRSYRTFPQTRTKFSELQIRFDLSSFHFNRTNINLFRGNYRMLLMGELRKSQDSIIRKMNGVHYYTKLYLAPYLTYFMDSISKNAPVLKNVTYKPDLIKNIPKNRQGIVMDAALRSARNLKQVLLVPSTEYKQLRENLASYQIEWHRKIIISVSILVLFLIGAPLGAIIRKGGLGLPSVVSVVLFILYYIISIASEKLAKQCAIDTFTGMWLPVFVLFPLGLFLVYKANRDSTLFNLESYSRFIEKLNKLFTKKK